MDLRPGMALFEQLPIVRPIVQPRLHGQVGGRVTAYREVQVAALKAGLFLNARPPGGRAQNTDEKQHIIKLLRDRAAHARLLDRLIGHAVQLGLSRIFS